MGNFTLKPGFGMFPESLKKEPRISKLNLKSGQVSELPVNHWAQLDPGEQAVILFQPFPNNSHQQRLEGDHRASKAVGVGGMRSFSGARGTTSSGDRFKLQQALPFTGFGADREPVEGPGVLSLLSPLTLSLYFIESLTNWGNVD